MKAVIKGFIVHDITITKAGWLKRVYWFLMKKLFKRTPVFLFRLKVNGKTVHEGYIDSLGSILFPQPIIIGETDKFEFEAYNPYKEITAHITFMGVEISEA